MPWRSEYPLVISHTHRVSFVVIGKTELYDAFTGHVYVTKTGHADGKYDNSLTSSHFKLNEHPTDNFYAS